MQSIERRLFKKSQALTWQWLCCVAVSGSIQFGGFSISFYSFSMLSIYMAIPHLRSGQTVNIQPLGSRLLTEKTVALFKSDELEVIRLVLLTGKSLPPHSVPGEITIQCIEGRIDVPVEGTSHVLGAGQMLFLSANVVHGVMALEDSSALVTIVLSPRKAL
jgi:quercetin dioxygenase-like cupin family protein